MTALIVIGCVLLYGTVGSMIGTFAYLNVKRWGDDPGMDAMPTLVMTTMAWPIAWPIVLGYWFSHRNQDDRHGYALNRKQRAKIEYEREMLEIERKRNTEMERSHRIIADFTRESSHGS